MRCILMSSACFIFIAVSHRTKIRDGSFGRQILKSRKRARNNNMKKKMLVIKALQTSILFLDGKQARNDSACINYRH